MNLNDLEHSYFVKDFVYGSIDGIVTTFAIVSGVIGASLQPIIILILGFANLLADGFSMAVSNYLSNKSELELYEKERAREAREVKEVPHEEVQDIKDIFIKKGFKGSTLNKIVKTITSNKEVWIDTMMKEELGLSIDQTNPRKSALITFLSFNLMGFIPLIAFLLPSTSFIISVTMSFTALFFVGVIKSFIVHKQWYISGLQTLLIGGLAAVIAYSVGFLGKGLM